MSAPARACQPALRNKFGHRFPIKGGWRELSVSCVKVTVGRAERARVYNGRDKASLMGVFIQLGGLWRAHNLTGGGTRGSVKRASGLSSIVCPGNKAELST